ncbi:MAG: DUF6325 family protein [Patescibacteria group bacterium]
MLGPIDYIVVGFEGNNFNGSILEELGKAVDTGAIRVVDLLFIIKDADGAVLLAEIEDQHEELKAAVDVFNIPDDLELLTESDVEKLGAALENDSSAGVLVIEHLWAKGLKQALLDSGGVLIDEGRIHPDVVEAAVSELSEIKE